MITEYPPCRDLFPELLLRPYSNHPLTLSFLFFFPFWRVGMTIINYISQTKNQKQKQKERRIQTLPKSCYLFLFGFPSRTDYNNFCPKIVCILYAADHNCCKWHYIDSLRNHQTHWCLTTIQTFLVDHLPLPFIYLFIYYFLNQIMHV